MGSRGNVSFSSLNHANNAVNNSIKKISTGSQHPSASYGASEYAITQRMNSSIGAHNQSIANTQNSNAMLNTAAGAINNTVNSLTSLRENIVNALNGTNGAPDLATLQQGINQTISQINENAAVTYNGQNLLDGSNPGTTVAGTFGYDTVPFGNMTSQGLGLTDSSGNSTINLTDGTSLSSALDTVDKALNSALDQATSIGAAQEGLDFQEANYVTASENLTASASTMDDTDIAAEAVNLKSAQAQQQLAMFGIQAHMGLMANRANVAQLLGH
ncbi:MAG: bacitracin resistance protein BacA [Selenomonadaceae bacterium]|nr:bacitracin resistance protein BacA [Selenomonadaceae bacterium]